MSVRRLPRASVPIIDSDEPISFTSEELADTRQALREIGDDLDDDSDDEDDQADKRPGTGWVRVRPEWLEPVDMDLDAIDDDDLPF